MRKIVVFLMAFVAFGCSSLNMSTLKCRDTQITSKTTLKQVQDMCLISKQAPLSSGLYEVQFRNDATQSSVKCDFANDAPDAVVNGCR